MAAPFLTIFTPTYNRAHTLPRLFESLKRQTTMDFEWLVIDDGSIDSTSALFEIWLNEDVGFAIRYYKVENGGKNRAINIALKLASGQAFMILDSDDKLTEDSAQFAIDKIHEICGFPDFIGISGRKGDFYNQRPLGYADDKYARDGYVDCTNIERSKYGLTLDMAEVFITEKIRKYTFKVWKNEKFVPEEVVWNQMALDGYKIRWYNKVTYLCEYQPEGMTVAIWSLFDENPMGYAMMFNSRLYFASNIKLIIYYVLQYISCCLVANEIRQVMRCRRRCLALILLPCGWLLSLRRRMQIRYARKKK